jgi:hypothetical protein
VGVILGVHLDRFLRPAGLSTGGPHTLSGEETQAQRHEALRERDFWPGR